MREAAKPQTTGPGSREFYVDDLEKIAQYFAELEGKGFDLLTQDGVSKENMAMRRWVDMHYRGQAHEGICRYHGDNKFRHAGDDRPLSKSDHDQ